MSENLIRVSKQNPCGGCNKTDWCFQTPEGDYLCARATSLKSFKFKDGSIVWLHKGNGTKPEWKPEPKKEVVPKIDAAEMMTYWRRFTKPEWIKRLSESLCVTVDSLNLLGVAWSDKWQSWAFPMSDGNGRVCGIRLRYDDGRKIAVTGSSQGVFLPHTPAKKTAYLCEGPTDTSAFLSLGVFAIGRPSASGGSLIMKQTIERLRIKEVIIVADNDDDKVTPSGVKFNPGYDGALSLSRILTCPRCIITLPAKDIREAVKMGMDAKMLDYIARGVVWEGAT